MPAAAIGTIVISLVLLVAVAVYLVRVVLILRRVTDTLGKITFGVRAIAHRLEPVNPTLDRVGDDLHVVAGVLEGLVVRVTGTRPEETETSDVQRGSEVGYAT